MLFSAQRVCCSACPLALGSSGSMCINSEDVARCKGVACFCRAIVESMRTRLVTQTGNSQIIHPMRQSAFIQASIMHRLSCKKVGRKLRICVLLFLINTPKARAHRVLLPDFRITASNLASTFNQELDDRRQQPVSEVSIIMTSSDNQSVC